MKLTFQDPDMDGIFERLNKELRSYDDKFHSFLSTNQDSFDIRLEKQKAKLQKKDPAFRYSIYNTEGDSERVCLLLGK